MTKAYRNIASIFILTTVVVILFKVSLPITESISGEEIDIADHDDELENLASLKALYDNSHYDSANSLGKDGLLRIVEIIEGDDRYLAYDFQKLLADSYRLLGFDKTGIEQRSKIEYLSKSTSIYQNLWDNYPYRRDVAEKLLISIEDHQQAIDFALVILEKDPAYGSIDRSLAYRYLELGNLTKAILHLKRGYANEENILYKKSYGRELLDLLRSHNKVDEVLKFESEYNVWLETSDAKI